MAGKKISLTECYKILQVSQNSSMAEVKQAYRKRAFELHPDLNPNSSSANLNFQKLNEAYVIIIDYLDAKELKEKAAQNAKQTQTSEKEQSSTKSWGQRVWSQKAEENREQEEKNKEEEKQRKEAERLKREEERKERIARERAAEERYRAKERAAREYAERNKLREKIAQDIEKRKVRQQEEVRNRAKRAEENEERERTRVLRQMEEEARRNKEASEQKTRAYSHLGKPIFDKENYQSTSTKSDKNSDFFTHSTTQKTQNTNTQSTKTKQAPPETDDELREQILKELLEDDYARKVYEDIYNELHARKEQEKKETKDAQNRHNQTEQKTNTEATNANTKKTVTAEYVRAETKKPPLTHKIKQQVGKKIQQAGQSALGQNLTEKFATNLKQGLSSWFKSQIDDELELFLPASKLIAGAKMRLQIRTGWMMNESHTVELTLPADFVPGKPFRLKGMGKKIGKWQGDLYLKLQVKQGK